MKQLWWILTLVIVLAACNQNRHVASENDVDAARNFLNAVLQGDFDLARTYMIEDTTNSEYMNKLQQNWAAYSPQERRGYRDASLTLYTLKPVNDSTTIVPYSISFTNKRDSVLVRKGPKEWLVDFKFTILPGSVPLQFSSPSQQKP